MEAGRLKLTMATPTQEPEVAAALFDGLPAESGYYWIDRFRAARAWQVVYVNVEDPDAGAGWMRLFTGEYVAAGSPELAGICFRGPIQGPTSN